MIKVTPRVEWVTGERSNGHRLRDLHSGQETVRRRTRDPADARAAATKLDGHFPDMISIT